MVQNVHSFIYRHKNILPWLLTVLVVAISSGVSVLVNRQPVAAVQSSKSCEQRTIPCTAATLTEVIEVSHTLAAPALRAATPPPRAKHIVTYSVTTKGGVSGFEEFKAQAAATLSHAQGWSGLGVKFREVASGGDFTLVLSEAASVPSFAPDVCDSTWSCAVGRYVIINYDRWRFASASWNVTGGSLRDYRHMVINHELGHWLGRHHESCSGSGNKAAVMQQQSINLQGCTFNPWPLPGELWSNRLGIKL